MKCWGRTKTLKRCGRNGSFLFCHDHWRVAIGTVLLLIGSAFWDQIKDVPKSLVDK
jgi:hypothetical protein